MIGSTLDQLFVKREQLCSEISSIVVLLPSVPISAGNSMLSNFIHKKADWCTFLGVGESNIIP